ncbi:MAG: glycogen/starch/alpha-glucan family phosphorylase, partial [Clostridia bacterium]
MTKPISNEELRIRIEQNLERHFGISSNNATDKQMYDAVASSVKNILLEKRNVFNHNTRAQKKKKVYYLCMEFLLGRSLKTNIYNLGIQNQVDEVLKTMGFDLVELYENETDAGLGNGGLGRLAACYMDSLASLEYPAMGFSIRYEYGLFKQKIVDGWQTEMPDIWLPGGEVWLTPRPDKNCTVKFGGKIMEVDHGNKRMEFEVINYNEVEAMAYDMMISGGDSEGVSVLRLWRARNIQNFNMGKFSQGEYMLAMKADNEAELISKVLYPSDDHYEGKSLRLKQQYFLVCASIDSIIKDVLRQTKDIRQFADFAILHINDTHPALVIPELMRVFMDDYKLGWDEAWDIVTKSTAYTNHTVLSEALECWSMDLFKDLLPRIWQIVCEIDARYRASSINLGLDQDTINRTAVIDYGAVKMANLSCIASKKVNGVSALHSEILKKTIFKDYYKQTPEKFINITNGIAHRRWLSYSNPRLDGLLTDLIGNGFRKEASKLKDFEKYADDTTVLNKLAEIKLQNKIDFANYVSKNQGISINPESRFDVQVKRLHEYKRQLLNILKIVDLYNQLIEDPDMDMTPQTFIFGAKAAPSYYKAKEMIELICNIQAELEKNPKIKEKLNVVFMENYCVTMAETLMPAAEVS